MPTDIIEMFWGCLVCKGENKGRHKTCQSCGKPRSLESPEWMPGDISPMAAVKDEKLLKKAKAGPDWECRYCKSSQFRADGCCAQCGSSQTDSTTKAAKPAPRKVVSSPEPPKQTRVYEGVSVTQSDPPFRSQRNWVWGILIASGVIGFIVLMVLLFRTKDVDAKVASVSWEKKVVIERYQAFSREGWNPAGGTDVHNQGPRIHHYDHVQVGSHPEFYTETYNCGETCTVSKGSCRTTSRTCTSNKNGFATCTGGDRVCDPDTRSCRAKTCTRQASRTVPEYEEQPRFQNWYTWTSWEWATNRHRTSSGNSMVTSWPSEQDLHLNVDLLPGEAERIASRTETYSVVFSSDTSYTYEPKSEADFRRFEPGKKFRLRVGAAHGVEVLP